MALKATIYKATVNVADLDRNQFLDASLTLARHPSETQERMMLRLLAWLKYADERLQFTRGLCADDEPEAWLRNDHLGIDLWIELGLPDERRIKKACTQAAEVALFTYNSRAAQIWWQQNQSTYNFEYADVDFLFTCFEQYEKEAQQLLALENPLPLPAYERILKAAHSFNLLDARKAISVTERQRYILRIRTLTKAVAEAYYASREALGFPMCNKDK